VVADDNGDDDVGTGACGSQGPGIDGTSNGGTAGISPVSVGPGNPGPGCNGWMLVEHPLSLHHPWCAGRGGLCVSNLRKISLVDAVNHVHFNNKDRCALGRNFKIIRLLVWFLMLCFLFLGPPL
jgi:hypothetical protein